MIYNEFRKFASYFLKVCFAMVLVDHIFIQGLLLVCCSNQLDAMQAEEAKSLSARSAVSMADG
jgi:hypothetical protein